jgi:ribonuclease Z
MFEITFLGTASAMPTTERSLPAIAVRHGGDIFLLDCGEGTQRQMMRYGVSYMKIKAILITHLHLDHFLGVFGLLETMRLNGRQEKLLLFCPPGGKAVFGRKDFLEVVEVSDGFCHEFPGFSVRAFAVQHAGGSFGFCLEESEKVRFYEEKAKGLGLRGPMFTEIQQKGSLKVSGKVVRLKDITYRQKGAKIAFSGDTAPCASLAKAAKGIDLLIHESTFGSDRQGEAKKTHHSTAQQAGLAAKKAGAKRLIITHFSGRYASTKELLEEARKAFPNAEAAHDGYKTTA